MPGKPLFTNFSVKLIKYPMYVLNRYSLKNGEPCPLNEGRRPGGNGEICGKGNEEGGNGTCGLGPGNMEYVSYPVRLPSRLFPSMAA